MERIGADFPALHAARRPEHPALIDAAGEGLSYAALHRRIGRVAVALRRRHGIGRGDRVALLAANAAETFVLQFACQRLGAILVPLHLRATCADLAGMIAQAAPALLLHDAANAVRARAAAPNLPRAPLAPAPGTEPGNGSEEGAEEALDEGLGGGALEAEAPCLLLFTSGTTAAPKAVIFTNRMMVANARNMALAADIGPDAVHPVILPLYHAAGFNLYANPVFSRGGTVTVPATTDAGALLALIGSGRPRPTHLFLVPTLYHALAAHRTFAVTDLSRLQVAGVGGDAASEGLLAAWAARGLDLRHGYGLTEAGPAALAQDARGAREAPGAVGLPLRHVEARLMTQSGPVAGCGSGELQLRGPAVSPGYWRDPAASAAAFQDGWLRSGDLARRDAAGRYWITGRLKEIVISGGENIHPAEIEAVLRAHPRVRDAGVAGLPDPVWGESLAAAVVVEPGLLPEELAAYCAARLARFKRPRRIVTCAEVPRATLGKIDRAALRALLTKASAPAGVECPLWSGPLTG